MTVDRKGENRLYIEMDLENVVTHLGRIRVDVKFIAADPTPDHPPNDESEMLRLTACLDQWSEELVHRLLTLDSEAEKSPRGRIIVTVVAAFQKHFGDILSPSQIKWSLDDDVELDDDYERSPIHICFEVRSDWEQIEELEEHAVAYLAELFNGQAVLTLEETRDMETTALELSRGSWEAEMPIFGRKENVEMEILDSMGRSARLLLDASSSAFFKILRAAPVAMSATPGGRRTLALLFIEGVLEESIDRNADGESEWSLSDWTNTGSNLIQAHGTTYSTEISAGDVARYIQGKWPDIFLSP